MYLPRLLSQLEGWTTCGAGTGITSGSGMTMEDSGAIEIQGEGAAGRARCPEQGILWDWGLTDQQASTHQLVGCSPAESGGSVPSGVHWLECGPICQQTLRESTKQTVCLFALRFLQDELQSRGRLQGPHPEGSQSPVVISGLGTYLPWLYGKAAEKLSLFGSSAS